MAHHRLIFLFLLFIFCQREIPIDRSDIAFGSYFRIKIFTNNIEEGKKYLDSVFILIKYYDSLFSYFNKKSELFFVNQNKVGRISEELKEIISLSKEIKDKTFGYFDITIAPLMELWGFYDKNYKRPKEKEIKEIKKFIGENSYLIKKDSIFLKEKAKIDLSGIAVGYILDKLVLFLKSKNIKKGIIDAGGDIIVFGDYKARIGIKDPNRNEIIEVIELKEGACATSGNYYNYFKIGDTIFSHIINPITGEAERTFKKHRQVTVIGKKGVICDALSTALLIVPDSLKDKVLENFKDYKVIFY
ncbi:MAG: FAD:protein FMN transferase [candidate division WOR-3 bacterium]|nr:FAD:protein FMN transferase [candidate division WOR-3 bacterium]MCX7836959.1 FAD:protein FMN transferase [candidate division WOR-3 bacterium]MDW8114087.1 FAD:protein FMN transferase [candidate division WOR-3 bacterium]